MLTHTMILNKFAYLLLMICILEKGLLYATEVDANSSKRPEVVNIGAIFSFNSTIGRVAKIAIQTAVDDVNSSPLVLHGTNLSISIQDSRHNGLFGIVETMSLMEQNVVAIIGPQLSVVAHVVSYIAEGLKVPLLSFAATDPTLSSLEYPFFVRTTQNDLFQMAAIADIVNYFGWKKVTAIYNDDDYGRNGIAALGDKLEERLCTISYKAALKPLPNREDITRVLFQVALQESRIIVLHTYSDHGLEVLNAARSLHMLQSGYVWIATDWLTNVIDTYSPLSAWSDVQGLLTLRRHTPHSEVKDNFKSRWSALIRRDNNAGMIGLNSYGLYAYDTIWILARALDEYFTRGGNISFSSTSMLKQLNYSNLHVDAMSSFDGGELLLSIIRQVNITGLTGHIQFDQDRNLINPAFDVVNVAGTGYNTIGYWSYISGLSVKPPEDLSSKPSNQTYSSQRLYSVLWPGHTTEKPRGWVFSNNRKVLRVGVPNRVDYQAFYSYSPSTDSFTGYCIDVFSEAVNLLPYAVPYTLVPFGNGIENPRIGDLIDNLNAGVFDAVIGDISITTNRTKKVDFTQPYLETGLVVVAPVNVKDSDAWAFLELFTPMMWCITGMFFIVVGFVIWILEHRQNDEFRGPPRKIIATMLWFSSSTWFFSHRETPVSSLGRLVLIIWLFVVFIIKSSYTASLSSLLTVQQVSSHLKGIRNLLESNEPIGYRGGSFVQEYLNVELSVPVSRLVALKSEQESEEALRKGPKNGGVAAIVDERARMELFLSSRCDFTIVDHEFTKNWWGFAFPRNSPLAKDLSTAILKLSENGDLERIHDKWLLKRACSSQDTELALDRLGLENFWDIFLISGIACVLSLIMYFVQMVIQFIHHYTAEEQESDAIGQTALSSRLLTFLSFVSDKEEKIKGQSKGRQVDGSVSASDTPKYASNNSLVPS